METCINNLINGNIKTAKEQAAKFTFARIKNFMLECGTSGKESVATARFLKGQIGFQDYCDSCK